MRYARLGHSGLVVSRVGLGMMGYGDRSWRRWVVHEETAKPIARRAVEAGVTLFDTGDHYSAGLSEEITGRLVRALFPRRDDYAVATKVGAVLGPAAHQRGLSRRHIMTAVDDSLRRLGTGHIDIYQVHRFDPETPVEETVAALHDLVRAGKVRYLGAGSMYAWQFAELQHAALSAGDPGLIAMQNHYNLLYREEEREMIPLCADLGVGVIPWSPLARGLLAGNHQPDRRPRTPRATTDPHIQLLYAPDDFGIVDTVAELAARVGMPPATVALSWLLHRPGVVAPILGATATTHVDQAVAALDLTLTDRQTRQLEAPYRPHPVLGHT